MVEPAAWHFPSPLVRPAAGFPNDAADWIFGPGPGAVRLTGRPGLSATPDQPLAAIIPLDGALPVRLAALERLWRIVGGQAPEDPLPPQRRGRLRFQSSPGGAPDKELEKVIHIEILGVEG